MASPLDPASQESRDDILRIIHSAYSTIKGMEATKSLQPLSLDHVIQEHMDRIQNPNQGARSQVSIRSASASKGTRATRYEMLDRLNKELDDAVNAIKALKGSK